MNSLLNKFGIFDIFSMLLPGLCLMFITRYLLPGSVTTFLSFYIEIDLFTILIISYLLGVFLHEIGTIFDKKIMYKFLYGEDPRRLVLKKNVLYKGKPIEFLLAKKIKNILLNDLDIQEHKELTDYEMSEFIVCYCINVLDMNSLNGKTDKMLTISEMSRTLFIGCSILCLLQVFETDLILLLVKSILLLVMSFVFLKRKQRYEEYRIRILLRSFMIFNNNK